MGKLIIMARTAPPLKISNKEKRSREHLFPQEVTAMVKAAKRFGRHPLRDSTAECSGRRTAGFQIPLAYRSAFNGEPVMA